MISRLATKNDIQGILDLQEINLFENLSVAEKENGFVTGQSVFRQAISKRVQTQY